MSMNHSAIREGIRGPDGRRFRIFRSLSVAVALAAIVSPPFPPGSSPVRAADETEVAADRPNVILFLADDVGVSAFSCHGSDSFETPHTDQLAAEGIRFDYAFSHPICGPSRVSLMTGRYPFRTGGLRNGSSQKVDPEEEIPFSRLLHDAGYATFATGKWPWLGHMENREAWGFDEMLTWRDYGTPDRYWNPNLYVNDEKKSFPGEFGPDVMQDAIFEFIDDVRDRDPDRPFFVYYPSPLPHGPMTRTPDSESGDLGNAEMYRDMIEYMDKQIGDLRSRLEERDLAEDTLLIVTSDNGSLDGLNEVIDGETVLGGKGQITDGGVRVPCVCYWPGTVEAGRVTDELIDFTDFFPTILDVAGVDLPESPVIDGRSFAPLLRGESHRGREWVFYQIGHGGENHYAIREHDWKLDHDDHLFDTSSSLHREVMVDADSSTEARRAYARLRKAMEELDPEGGITP